MKFRITLIVLLLAYVAFAATPTPVYRGGYRQGDVSYKIGGEHTWCSWGGGLADTIYIPGATASVIGPIQIGYSPTVQDSALNQLMFDLNPEVFTLRLWIYDGNRDSVTAVTLADGYFETIDRTDSTKWTWNADSSNYFLNSGNYSRSDYGTWTFEVQTDTTRGIDYPLRVLTGKSYIRIVLDTAAADTLMVRWELIGEN